MKTHYCPADKATISYEGECNWCGEKEHPAMSPKQIQELAGHRTVSPWIIKLVQDAVEAEREACAKVCEETDPVTYTFGHTRYDDAGATAYACAAAIRARSDNG